MARALIGCVGAAALLTAGGCALQGAPVQPQPPHLARLHTVPPPPPISPFLDAPVSFLIRGHFARGEQVIVRVCLRPDHSIASSDIVESSGDPQFDQKAMTWAQRVRQRQSSPQGPPLAPCGAVRVELHDATQPAVLGEHDDRLG